MKDGIELNHLSQKFDVYYDNAKRYQSEGKLDLAKRNYLLSAEALMQMAKLSSPQVAKVKLDKAKRLIAVADSLGKEKPKNVNKTESSKAEEGGKEFASASIPNIHFSDIAGLDDVKEAIKVRMIYPLKHPEIYSAYNKKMGGGVLLYGPPGTGKTMIAKAIACEVGATFYAIKGSDIMSKYVGESEQNISALFNSARNNDLSIIFIDEIDTMLGKRGQDAHNDKRVNEFLQQIDGFSSDTSKILLLGATNRPWDIDSAAMRSGRFSEKIYVPLPDSKARRFLFDKNLKNIPLASDVDISALVEMSKGLSGADITEICDAAKIEPLKESILSRENNANSKLKEVCFADFKKAFSKIRPSATKEELSKLEEFAKEFNLDISTKDEKNVENETENFETESTKVSVENKKLEIFLQSNTLKILPGEPLRLEFFLDGNFTKVYAKVGSKNFVCKQNIRNWIIDDIGVDAGEYNVQITADGVEGNFTIKVIKGMEEEDYDF